jgi:hypothetical protein
MTLQKLALMLATMMLLPACSNRSEDAATALRTQLGIGSVAEARKSLAANSQRLKAHPRDYFLAAVQLFARVTQH